MKVSLSRSKKVVVVEPSNAVKSMPDVPRSRTSGEVWVGASFHGPRASSTPAGTLAGKSVSSIGTGKSHSDRLDSRKSL